MKSLKQLILLTALSLCASLMLSSCTKNEFSVKATITGSGSRSVNIAYMALAKETQEFVSLQLPFVDNSLEFKGATRYPTIVWLMSSDGQLLHWLYAEKGDELEIKGDYGSPLLWKVSGNKVMEQYCEWLAQNSATLQAYNAESVNAAVKKYVADHPSETASAIILLAHFHRTNSETEFKALWDKLTIDSDLKAHLLDASMHQFDTSNTDAAKLPMVPLALQSRGDSLVTINPATRRATILYFWRSNSGPHKSILQKLAALPADVAKADIFLDPDSIQWHYMLKTDTIKGRTALWAFGGEMNLALKRLNIPGDPFIIVANRQGAQQYRGSNINDALKALNAIH